MVRYMDPKLSNVWVNVVIWISLVSSFSIVTLIPFDYEISAYHLCKKDPLRDCPVPGIVVSERFLKILWNSTYWTSFVLVWAFLNVVKAYTTTAEFKKSQRLKTAIRGNLRFYLFATIGGVFGVMYLLIRVRLTFGAIFTLLMALVNIWGLFLLIILCGPGLVTVPRSLWRKSNYDRQLKYCEFVAGSRYNTLQTAKDKVHDITSKVIKVASQIPTRNDLYPYISQVLAKCPLDAMDSAHSTSMSNMGKGNGIGGADVTYLAICNLHKDVITRTSEARIAEQKWNNLVSKYCGLKDLLALKRSRSSEIPSKGLVTNSEEGGNIITYIWLIHVLPVLLKVLSLLCWCLTVLILFSEFTIIFPRLNSPIASLISLPTYNFKNMTSLYFMVPIGYILLCGFKSLTTVRISKSYSLLPKLTTPSNGVFLGGFMLRIIFPVCYNFLTMVTDPDANPPVVQQTQFLQLFAFEDYPVLGLGFNQWMPLAIIITSLLTAGECFSSVLKVFGVASFDYEEVAEDPDVLVEGRALLSRARDTIVREKLEKEVRNPLNSV
ncbi:hypothetical protein RCL1_008644 [Eukaryota sp. TZLM3-RCL]